MYSKIPVRNAVQKECTKYFVNGIECEPGAIYQIILDHKFYTGAVNLNKKCHFERHEEKVKKEQNEYLIINSEDISTNINANFGLNTKEFTAKVNPTSEGYKQLINKMIHVLDMLYEAQKNYNECSTKLSAAIRDCMTLVFDNLTDINDSYNNILNKSSIEHTVFTFDMLAFSLSCAAPMMDKAFDDINLPSLNFDMSAIKEKWNETWTNSKKSKFLNEYLSLMLKQTDNVHQLWRVSDLAHGFGNNIDYKFDELKKVLQSLEAKRVLIDAFLLDMGDKPRISTNVYNFHYAQPLPIKKDIKEVLNLTPNV